MKGVVFLSDFVNLIKSIVDSAPTWVKIIIYLIIIVGTLAIFAFIIAGSFKFMKSVDKESRALDLSRDNREISNELSKISREKEEMLDFLEMLQVYILKVKLTIQDIQSEDYKQEGYESDTGRLISDFINLISNKICIGNHSRVSLWVIEDIGEDNAKKEAQLKVLYRSSNFPYNSSKSKYLNIDESIAGRAYRKKKSQFSVNLEEDDDWENYSSTAYNEIFAFPINQDYVLTIDFKKKTRELDRIIAQESATYLSYIYEMIEYLDAKELADKRLHNVYLDLINILSNDEEDSD